MIRLTTTTNTPVSIIRLEKRKYFVTETDGYHSLEPNGWYMLMKAKVKMAVYTINLIMLPFSFR